MTKVLNGIDQLAQHLLTELEEGQAAQIDISARDAAGGGLLMLLLALHEAATKRRVDVVVSQRNESTIRLSVPSAH